MSIPQVDMGYEHFRTKSTIGIGVTMDKRKILFSELPQQVRNNFYARTLAEMHFAYKMRIFYYKDHPRKLSAVINEAKSHFENGDPFNTGRKGYYNFTW